MKKKIICTECDGRGYISHAETWSDGNGVGGGRAWSEPCVNCDGTGEVEVPMTNYDFIKSLNVEDMAEYFGVDRRPHFPSSPCYVCEYDDGLFCGNDRCNDEYKKEVYKRWLNQEYKGDEK